MGLLLFSASRTFAATDVNNPAFPHFYRLFAGILLIALMAPTFFAARLHRTVFNKHRRLVIWLSLVGALTVFNNAPYFGVFGGAAMIIFFVIASIFLAALLISLILYMLLNVEHVMMNRWPEKWTSAANLLRFNFASSSGVSWAVIRGAALAGTVTGVYSLSRFIEVRYRLAAWLPWPVTMDHFQTFSPSWDIVAEAALHALAAVLMLAFIVSLVRRYSGKALLLIAAGSATWLFSGRYVAVKYDTPAVPMEWLTVFVVGSIVCFALVRFDVLTQFVCLFSSYLFIETYAFWNLFRDVGNFQYSAVFVCCGALILLSAFLAFRPSFVAAKARLAKIYE